MFSNKNQVGDDSLYSIEVGRNQRMCLLCVWMEAWSSVVIAREIYDIIKYSYWNTM